LDSLVVSGALGIDSGSDDDFLVDGETVDLEGDCVGAHGSKLYHVLGVEDGAQGDSGSGDGTAIDCDVLDDGSS